MFTGIIESIGRIRSIKHEAQNLLLEIESEISQFCKVDQSIAHNGICLTVIHVADNFHTVCAIDETIQKTTINFWKEGDLINLERCMKLDARLDGHIVQGHVDCITQCNQIEESDGSWIFTFNLPEEFAHLMVEKGSISVNGTSLTCFNVTESSFQVAIIPYTYQHTSIHLVKKDAFVNIEFDIIGKYVSRKMSLNKLNLK